MKTRILLLSAIFLASCTAPQKKQEAALLSAPAETDFFAEEPAQQASVADRAVETKAEKPVQEDKIEFSDVNDVSIGYASWYGRELHGKPTASGEVFDMNDYTAAHRKYPMGSIVLVKNLENNKKQLVRINDRGPFVDGRVIDVSFAVARDLGFAEQGVVKVQVELVEAGKNEFMKKSEATVPVQTEPVKTEEPLDEETLFADEEEILESEGIQKASSEYVYADGLSPEGYTVQIGAFKKRSNAEKYRRDMQARYNQRAFIASREDWHFVWIGDFETVEDARAFYRKLRDDGVDVMYRGKVS